jgi:hypothetical protein
MCFRNWIPVVWPVPLGPVVEALVKPPHDSGEEDNAPAKARQEHYAMQCCDVSGQAKREKIIALGKRRLESSTNPETTAGEEILFSVQF